MKKILLIAVALLLGVSTNAYAGLKTSTKSESASQNSSSKSDGKESLSSNGGDGGPGNTVPTENPTDAWNEMLNSGKVFPGGYSGSKRPESF